MIKTGLEVLGEDRAESDCELEPEQVQELLEQLESRLREDDTSAVGLLEKIRSQFSSEQVGELEEAIGAVRSLCAQANQGHGKPLSKERLQEIQSELKVLEAERAKAREAASGSEREKLRQEAQEQAKNKSYAGVHPRTMTMPQAASTAHQCTHPD